MQYKGNSRRLAVAAVLLGLLCACGGGGDGGGSAAQSSSSSPTSQTDTFVPAGGVTPSGSGLAANGARAVPTYESIGLYWKPPSNPGSSGCPVIFRKNGDATFRQGLDLWYDPANGECRGS